MFYIFIIYYFVFLYFYNCIFSFFIFFFIILLFFKPNIYIITVIITIIIIMLINITITGILERSNGREFQIWNSSGMVYHIHLVKWWISRFRGAYKTPTASETELFLILVKGFQSLYNVTRSLVLVAWGWGVGGNQWLNVLGHLCSCMFLS